jgi:hypothetical protein
MDTFVLRLKYMLADCGSNHFPAVILRIYFVWVRYMVSSFKEEMLHISGSKKP